MDEPVGHWTVLSDEAGLVNAKQESTRLAFAPLPKFHTQHGRFQRRRAEFPDEVVGTHRSQVPQEPVHDADRRAGPGRQRRSRRGEPGGLTFGRRGAVGEKHRSPGSETVWRLIANFLTAPRLSTPQATGS
ncbi:hypothetical protein [Streptosporangium sp. NPDC051022]|uniref:hypothetical protein n=1 Tax=Streptosporangium sp. NPDC051022 TaxID=3155752 RepID=UPI003439A772